MAGHNAEFGYRALFKTRYVPSIAASMAFARLPTGVTTIVLVLFISQYYGAAVSGMATAAFTAGMAVFGPLFGRVVDKGHGPAILRILAVSQMVAMIALVGGVSASLPATLAVLSSFLCGALMPPIAGVTRSLWPSMLDMQLVSTAYNFEVLIVDALYVTGPLLASVFVALNIPQWGLLLTTAGSMAGSLTLASLKPVGDHAKLNRERIANENPSVESKTPASKEVAKPITKTALLTLPVVLLLAAPLTKFCYSGWVETLYPLYYSDMGNAALSSIAISVWSIGSCVGVLLFARLQPSTRRMTRPRQLAVFTAGFVATTLLTSVGLNDIVVMCVAIFVIGAAAAPGDNLYYQLAGELAPQKRQAEMFSWLNTCTSIGFAAGAFFAGISAETCGWVAAFALPSSCALASFLVCFALAVICRRRASA